MATPEIRFGLNELQAVFLGSNEVKRIYLGNKIVYENENENGYLFSLDSQALADSIGNLLVALEKTNFELKNHETLYTIDQLAFETADNE